MHLHDDAAVLVVDETGDLKKGSHTVAVQRQYTGRPQCGRVSGKRLLGHCAESSGRRSPAVRPTAD
ncbi:hypothetical protein QF032_006352 [Streptomyces achromogenes]|nr:hypothetical protein [Streptomyces achromogenes]